MRSLRERVAEAGQSLAGWQQGFAGRGARQGVMAVGAVVALFASLSFSGGVMTTIETTVANNLLTPTAVVVPTSTDEPGPAATSAPEVEPPPTPSPTARPTATPVPTPESTPTSAPTAEPERANTSSRGSSSRNSRTIVVDPGHGGKETGAVGKTSAGTTLREKDLTLAVSLAAAEELTRAGHQVILTRTADVNVNGEQRDVTGNGKVDVSDDLQARVDLANRERADLLVSVHFNSGGSAARGTEVFYNASRPFAEQSRQLATSVYDHLLRTINGVGYNVNGRGVKRDVQATGGASFFLLGPRGGFVVRESAVPAALGEALFISQPAEADLLADSSFLAALGRAYAEGVLAYLEQR